MPVAATRLIRFIVVAALVAAAAPAHATAQRTFVASNGSDANACSLLSPCRSFNAAIANTTAGGEVVILDTAGYGPMFIDRSIKVIGPSGVYGGISVLGGISGITTGVVINAPGATVTLRGLDISGVPGGAPLPSVGIDIQDAKAVHIERSSIGNFTQDSSACIRATSPGGQRKLFLVDSFLRECRTFVLADGTLGRVDLQIDNTRFERGLNTVTTGNDDGILMIGGGQSSIRNSSIRGISNTAISTVNSTGFGSGLLISGSQIYEFGTAIAIDSSSIAQVAIERSEIGLSTGSGAGLTVNATAGGSARLSLLETLVQRTAGIATSGFGGGLLNVDIVRSNFIAFGGRILDHGFGVVTLNDVHMNVCSESLVNSGSAAVYSKDKNNLITCDDAPGPAYITPILIPGK